MDYVAIVTSLALMQAFFFAVKVGQQQGKRYRAKLSSHRLRTGHELAALLQTPDRGYVQQHQEIAARHNQVTHEPVDAISPKWGLP